MSKKQTSGKQLNFYKIESEKVLLTESDTRKISFGKKLISLSTYQKKNNYNEVIFEDKKDYYLSIFYENSKQNNPWKDFFSPLEHDTTIKSEIINFKPQVLSFTILLKIKNDIYAFSGGYGHNLLNNLTVPRFGIEIITRLLDKENISPTHTGERMLFGSVISAKRFFRKGWNLSYDNSIGKLYSELSTIISDTNLKPIFQKTGVSIDSGATCIASNTFQVRKSITYKQSIQIIKNINKLFIDIPNPKITINGITLINNNDPIFQKLDDNLMKEIHSSYTKKLSLSGIDIVPETQADRFMFASAYSIRKSGGKKDIITMEDIKYPTLNTIFDKIRNSNYNELDNTELHEFTTKFNSLNILIDANDGTTPLRNPLKDILNGEVVYNKKSYFKLGKSWLELKKVYLDRLNTKCLDIISESWNDTLLSPQTWNKGEDEYDFIEHFTTDKNFIVGHPIKVEEMELFDLVKVDDANQILFIIHAKKDFDVKMRDLHQQIVTSSVILEEDVRTNTGHLKKLYKSIYDKANSKTIYKRKYDNSLQSSCKNTIEKYSSESLFINLFKDYKRVYCVAFVDHKSKKYTPIATSIVNSKSNIAKQSLVEIRSAIAQITDFGEKFKLIQLKW